MLCTCIDDTVEQSRSWRTQSFFLLRWKNEVSKLSTISLCLLMVLKWKRLETFTELDGILIPPRQNTGIYVREELQDFGNQFSIVNRCGPDAPPGASDERGWRVVELEVVHIRWKNGWNRRSLSRTSRSRSWGTADGLPCFLRGVNRVLEIDCVWFVVVEGLREDMILWDSQYFTYIMSF